MKKTEKLEKTKKGYEKPSIRQVQTGMMNKYGNNPGYARKIRDHIDGVSIDALTREFGSPLFVFSEKKLRQQFREINRAFTKRYPKVTFGWSYKTNYLSAICAMFHQEGAMAEVVSQMEYDKARQLGMDGADIIFNGPSKSRQALRRAIQEGAKINIDHLDEMYLLESLSLELDKTVKVGMRINMDTGIQPQWSRFGLNLESGQAMETVKRMAKKGRLVLNGLHTHIGTYILDPSAYAQAVRKLLQFAKTIKSRFGYNLDYLDLGGGFPSKSQLKGSYYSPDMMVPPIDEYAKKITQAIFDHGDPDNFPELILESGRSMIDSSGYLISTVTASKRLPDGRKAYVADAGINLLYTSNWYKHNIEFDRAIHGPSEPSVIYGPLCMNIDVIEESIMLPQMSKGTRMTLWPVGAYNVTQWMQFITYRPGVVLIGENQEIDLIREPEDLTDINRRERLPKRLTLDKTRKEKRTAA